MPNTSVPKLPPLTHLPRYIVAVLIRLYQLTLSFWLGRQCRFTPSCSAYTREAVLKFGVRRGGWLGLKRMARCGPWGGPCAHQFDPVPDSWHGWRDKLKG